MADGEKTTRDILLTPNKSKLLQDLIELKSQGKQIREMVEITGASDSTVRKYLRAHYNVAPRKYKRSVLNYETGQPFQSVESTKLKALKVDNTSLKKELQTARKQIEKLTKEKHDLQRDKHQLTTKVTEATSLMPTIMEELAKLKDEKAQLNTTIHKIKAEGYVTEQQKAQLINDHLLANEKRGLQYTDPSDPGCVIPVHYAFYKTKSSISTKK